VQSNIVAAWRNVYITEIILRSWYQYTRRQQVYRDLISTYLVMCWPGSSVGTATGYGLDGPGIESWWDRDFSHLSRPALGPNQPPVQ
jgi:hypothetical protein